jgi:CDP-diacylglycerol--serine O-phosphatidyltransferase
MLSGLLIFMAMIFDAFDGYMARLSKKSSDFGAQLDSLCDLVSFGVAPGFLLVKMCPSFTYQHRDVVWAIAAMFAVCAALRLARFNLESNGDEDHLSFSGLPSPAAAAAVASFAILFYTLRKETNNLIYAEDVDLVVQTILPFFGLVCALLMVSRLPYPHVVNQVLRGSKSFGYLVALVFAATAILTIRGFSLPVVCTIFVLAGPASWAWRRLTSETVSEEPIF